MKTPATAGVFLREAHLTPIQRFAFRLRRIALRWYELALFAMLLGLVVAAAVPAAADPDDADEASQCGSAQIIPAVRTR